MYKYWSILEQTKQQHQGKSFYISAKVIQFINRKLHNPYKHKMNTLRKFGKTTGCWDVYKND